ncbi:hypothetical protein AB0J11_44885 [Streptomyces hokutonensis]
MGLGSDDDGSEVGVVVGSVVDVDVGDVLPAAVVGVSDSEGLFVPFPDSEGEALRDADASGEAEPAPVPTVFVAPKGSAVPLASEDAAPSADASPGAAGFEVENGASVPSSARLSPPAASTKPAVTRSTRRRRRRCAAALRSRRLAPTVSGPSVSPSPSLSPRPRFLRRAARPSCSLLCSSPDSSAPEAWSPPPSVCERTSTPAS